MAFINASSKQNSSICMYYIFLRPRVSLFIGVMCVPAPSDCWIYCPQESCITCSLSYFSFGLSLSYLPHTYAQTHKPNADRCLVLHGLIMTLSTIELLPIKHVAFHQESAGSKASVQGLLIIGLQGFDVDAVRNPKTCRAVMGWPQNDKLFICIVFE